MSNYPDDFDAAAHDARYAQTYCLVDDWHKAPRVKSLILAGYALQDADDGDGYRSSIAAINDIREQAFDNCNCGRCADSNNWATDGESLINDAMVSA